jgi:hypothetical protein
MSQSRVIAIRIAVVDIYSTATEITKRTQAIKKRCNNLAFIPHGVKRENRESRARLLRSRC